MSDIEELNRRILSALDRVASGIDGFGAANRGEVEALRKALDEEREVNAQLTERVRVLGERQEQVAAKMEAKAVETEDRMNKLDTQLQQLRKAQELLAEAGDALREANAEGVGDPDLINRSLEAELEALRAMRQAELAEADEIIAGLMPLLKASAMTQQAEETH